MYEDLVGKKGEKLEFTTNNTYLTFYDGDEQIGALNFEGGYFQFEGDAEKSAQIFFDYLGKNCFDIGNRVKLGEALDLLIEARDEIRGLYDKNEKMESELFYYKQICSSLQGQLAEKELLKLNSALPRQIIYPIKNNRMYSDTNIDWSQVTCTVNEIDLIGRLSENPLFNGDIEWLMVACEHYDLREGEDNRWVIDFFEEWKKTINGGTTDKSSDIQRNINALYNF
jgi:hypothetical protein